MNRHLIISRAIAAGEPSESAETPTLAKLVRNIREYRCLPDSIEVHSDIYNCLLREMNELRAARDEPMIEVLKAQRVGILIMGIPVFRAGAE